MTGIRIDICLRYLIFLFFLNDRVTEFNKFGEIILFVVLLLNPVVSKHHYFIVGIYLFFFDIYTLNISQMDTRLCIIKYIIRSVINHFIYSFRFICCFQSPVNIYIDS